MDGACLEPRRRLDHQDGVMCLCVQGTRLYTGGLRSTYEWDLLSGQRLRVFEGHSDFIWSIAVRAQSLFTCSAQNLTLEWALDSVDAKPQRRYEASYRMGDSAIVWSCAAPSEQTVLYTGGSDRTARKWCCCSGKELLQFVGHDGWITVVAACGEDCLITGSADGSVRQWNSLTGEQLLVWQLTDWVMSLTVGGGAVWCGLQDKWLVKIDLQTGAVHNWSRHAKTVVSIAHVTADGRPERLYTGCEDGSAREWCVITGGCLTRYELAKVEDECTVMGQLASRRRK